MQRSGETVRWSALEGAGLAAAARTPARPRLALFLVASLSLVIAGASAEVFLMPRAVPRPELPLREKSAHLMTVADAEALLARVGQSIPQATRQRVAEALVSEGARNGFDPIFLMALIGVESRYRLGAESERGARGLLQLKPSTFAWISAREPDVGAEDLESGDDPVADVRLSARYFRWLEHRFQSRQAALIAYNAGPRNAARALKGGDVPERWRAYPQLVRREYERLLRINSGGQDIRPELLLANLEPPPSAFH